MLSLEQLYTEADNTNNDDDANDDDNDDSDTNHDCIGSLACMSNDPKETIEAGEAGLVRDKACVTKMFVSASWKP